jgi:hypothetical protein
MWRSLGRKDACGVFGGERETKRHLEVLDVDGRIILKWIIGVYYGRALTELNSLRIGIRGGISGTRR